MPKEHKIVFNLGNNVSPVHETLKRSLVINGETICTCRGSLSEVLHCLGSTTGSEVAISDTTGDTLPLSKLTDLRDHCCTDAIEKLLAIIGSK